MAPVQEPEIQFAQRLASNEKIIRNKTLKKLRKYITVRSQKGKDGFTEEELLKLWKGLFYCLWMQDKPLLQEELSNHISCLLHNFQTLDGQLLYLETFLQTVKREWNGIDRLRMDKFFQLVRFVFRQTFELLKKTKWDTSVVSKFLELLNAQVLRTDSEAPVGLQLHTLDLYLTELSGVGATELTADQNLTFIDPFCKTAAKTKDRVLLSAICKEIFRTIIDQAPFAVQDLMRELKAAGAKDSDSGQASEEDEIDGEDVPEKTKSLKRSAGKQLNGTKSNEEEEEDDLDEDEDELLHLEEDSDTEIPDEEEDIGPVLQFDYTGLADKLFQLASRSNTPSYNRQKLYKIIKMLRDLSEGVFPQDEYPEEVSTDEDDDMFGSRSRVKRVKRRKGEDVEDTRGPAAKKAKGKEEEAAEADEPNQTTKDDSEPEADSTVTKKKKKRKKKAEKTKGVGGKETTETEVPAVLSPPADSATDGPEEAVMETSTSVVVEKPSSVKVTDEATPMETEGESEILLPLEVKAKTESSVMVTDEPKQKKKKTRKTKSVDGEEAAETKALDTDTEAPAALSPPTDSATDGEKEAVLETSISVLVEKPSSVEVIDEVTPTETEGKSEILLPLEVKSKNESSVMVMEEPNQPELQATKDKLEEHEEASTPTVMEGKSDTLLPLEDKATSVTEIKEPSQPVLQATEDRLKAQDQSEALSKKKSKRKKSILSSVDGHPSELVGDTSSPLAQDAVRPTEQPEITPETDTTTPAKNKKKAEKKAEEAVGEAAVEGDSAGGEITLVSCEASTGETTITSVADTTTPDETTITSVADTTTPGKKRNRKKSLKVKKMSEEVEVQVEDGCAGAAVTSGNCDSSTEDATTPPIKTMAKREIKITPEEPSGSAPVISEASTDDTMTTSLTDTTTPAKKKKNKKSLKVEETTEDTESHVQAEGGNTAAKIVPIICEASTEDATTTPLKMKRKKTTKGKCEKEKLTQEEESELAPVISEASTDETTAPTDTTTPAKKKKNKKVEKKADEAESQEGGNTAAEVIPIISEASTDETIAPTDTTTPAKKKKNKKSLKVEDEAESQEGGNTAAEVIPIICEASTEDAPITPVEDTTTPKRKKKKSLKEAQEAESEAPIEGEGGITEVEIAVGSEAPTEDTSTLPLKKTKKKKSKQDVKVIQEETEENVMVETPPAEEPPIITSTMTPVKKKKQKAAKTEEPLEEEEATVGETAQEMDLEEAPMEITMATPVQKKKKKQKAAAVGEVKDQGDADEPAVEVLSSSVKKGQKNKRKIPVVIEFESEEIQAEQDAAKKPKLNKLVKEQSTPLGVKKLQKKKKASQDSDFQISFHSDTVIPSPLFCKTKAKGRPSTPHPSKMKDFTSKSDSKKVTFGLKNNKTAEFRKTDRSLLLSPEGLSRVPFDPKQRPRCGVLKSPGTSPTVGVTKNPKAKKSLVTPKRTPKGRPTAADFF